MSDDKQVNQPQNDVQEAEVKQTQTDEKPTASFNQEDVDRIVKQRLEAEKAKHQRMLDEQKKKEDEALKEKVESKNKLESYLFSVRSTMLNDDKMKTALGDDAETVEKTTQEGLDWLDSDEDEGRTKEDYDNKHKEVEGVLMPLVQKAYQANMPQQQGGMPQQQEPDMGPSVEEID